MQTQISIPVNLTRQVRHNQWKTHKAMARSLSGLSLQGGTSEISAKCGTLLVGQRSRQPGRPENSFRIIRIKIPVLKLVVFIIIMSYRSMFSSFRSSSDFLDAIKRNATLLQRHPAGPAASQWNPKSYDKLIESVGDAKVVMIGEASHGTYDFYRERAEITKRLILEKGFRAVTIEGDWPDAYKINRYISGEDGNDVKSALSEFKRFPRWMWRNEVMLEFVEWLRVHNASIAEDSQKVCFYGLDLYSMFESAHEVVQHLKEVDPSLAKEAKERYNCFERHGTTQRYGYATAFNMSKSCEQSVSKVLMEMVKRYDTVINKRKDGKKDIHEEFYAKMNAQVVKDAEEYYRKMFADDTWNMRDSHMVNTLKEVMKHIEETDPKRGVARAVVWAHNSHLGDAGATDASIRGETNIGELARKYWQLPNTFNIGFTTYDGTVTAAHEWDAPGETMKVKTSLKGSNEELLHDTGLENFYLIFRSNSASVKPDSEVVKEFQKKRPERFIGVIYRPATEKQSHYYDCKLSSQYDAVIHLDRTRALRAMDKESELFADEEDTYPSGL
eukprot:TRINITY_DN9107_c0_g1_i1.p1 TRINITY_DN9107_c0_g1~~TRINITY_DN9107_c0_g1_i1.p1  ORF type:complete len:557 (+),score=111.04 TRINITY_DN9107_c0_g1_i1:97-1767(+)